MDIFLQKSVINSVSAIRISGSKSETNRLLLLQAIFPEIVLENISGSDDSEVMINALKSEDEIIDIHHAGTAMRFLTAYFASEEGKTVILTGSERMKERPIKILVDALKQLGAQIDYTEKEGFPPIKIIGKTLTQNKISIKAGVSSQYISALLLIAPKLQNGLELVLEGKITSIPYIKMTLALLDEIGIRTLFRKNKTTVFSKPKTQNPKPKTQVIESDWSSASYFYSIAALSSSGTQIELSSYKKNSLQGDSALAEIYKNFGVTTDFLKNTIVLTKQTLYPVPCALDLNNTPDIAQTIAVTCFGLGIGCHLTGLRTLKIKETDRLKALKAELGKLGAKVSVTDDSLTLQPSATINSNIRIATYNDHRMAMAFAPLALKVPIIIENAEVVSKSYPDFWNDLQKIGFELTQQ
jgi:3-phosphoshikimate 1-carboxyvinyltransferase